MGEVHEVVMGLAAEVRSSSDEAAAAAHPLAACSQQLQVLAVCEELPAAFLAEDGVQLRVPCAAC